jgi:TonB family protein
MEAALIPPEAETRYDFKRLPIPAEKVHKLIILEGTILAEGTVENLKVHEGVTPEMDAAAVRAFSQWTFKPAMRAGKPVSLYILVGIPAVRPSTESDVATKIAGYRGVFDKTGKSN